MPVDLRDPAGGTQWRGASFVYVLPCVLEDLCKLGMSRDPLRRMQALHPRYYEFFDLQRALLVETETVRDARAIETRLRRALSAHNAAAPLTIVEDAGGHTEWYRGAYALLSDAVDQLELSGHRVHRPASPWVACALARTGDLVHDWAAAMLPVDELEHPDMSRPVQRAVRDALDAYANFGLPVEALVPAGVLPWYRRVRAA